MPRSLSPALLALACLCCCTAGAAEGEVVVADIRVGIGAGTMPDKQDGSAVAPAALKGDTWVQEYDAQPGLAVSFSSVYGSLAPVGILVGVQFCSLTGEMDFESFTYNGAITTADDLVAASGDTVPGMGFSQSSMALNLGVGWALSSSWHVEVLGIGGVAYTTLDSPSGTLTTDLMVQEGQGWGFQYGGRVGLYWTDPASSWQIGLEGEYTVTETELTTVYDDIKFEADIENAGPTVRVSFGRRL